MVCFQFLWHECPSLSIKINTDEEAGGVQGRGGGEGAQLELCRSFTRKSVEKN